MYRNTLEKSRQGLERGEKEHFVIRHFLSLPFLASLKRLSSQKKEKRKRGKKEKKLSTLLK